MALERRAEREGGGRVREATESDRWVLGERQSDGKDVGRDGLDAAIVRYVRYDEKHWIDLGVFAEVLDGSEGSNSWTV